MKIPEVHFTEFYLAVPSEGHLRCQMGEGGTKRNPKKDDPGCGASSRPGTRPPDPIA